MSSPASAAGRFTARVDGVDWDALAAEVTEHGCALLPRLLEPGECAAVAALYEDDDHFRSTIDMKRHRYGAGEYRYFKGPLPEPVEHLRQALYPRLLPIARDWNQKLRRDAEWPETLDEWLEQCHAAGQTRPTPLLLRYREGDWNALHRDLYGDLVFPLQVAVNLSAPGSDYTGGEFLLVEQRPRAQSRGTSIVIPQGHGLVLTTRDRPVRTARGWSASAVRHGVSTLRSGERTTLGIIFHDAA